MLHRYISIFALVILAHGAIAQGWTKLKGPHGGTVEDFEYDAASGKLYAIVNNHLFVSTSSGTTWTEIPMPTNYYIEDILIDGTTLVGMLNGSQLMFSVDGGVTWEERGFTFLPIRTIRKLPGAGMFVGYGEYGIQVTLDEGLTWKKILDITPGWDLGIEMVVAGNGDIFVAHTPVGFQKYAFPADPSNPDSWDATNWTISLPYNLDYPSIVITPADKIFITYYNTAQSKTVIESSIDYGESWQPVPMTGFSGHDNIVEPVWSIAPTGKLYLFDNSFIDPELWEYTDGAPTPWVKKGWPTSPIPDQKVKCAIWTSNIQTFCGGGIDGVYRSSNTAASWSNVSTGLTFGDGWQLVVMQSGRVLYLQGVSPGGYYYSDNAGTPSEFWTFQPFPYPIRQLIELPDNSVMMNAGGYIHTSADGLNWTSYTSTAYHFNDIVVVAANDIYGFGSNGEIRTSIDKGQNWTLVTTAGLPLDMIIKATRDDDGYFYVFQPNFGVNDPDYWKLDSNVSPWQATAISTIPFASQAPYHSANDFFVSNNKVYLSSSGGTFFSTDKGDTWQTFTFSGVLIPITQGTGGIAISNPGNVAVTQDDGLTFTNYPLPGPDAWIRQIAMDGAGDFFAAATSSSAMKFTDDLVLAPEDQPVYIDFDWQPLSGGPYGGQIHKILKNSTDELFAMSGTNLYKYNSGLTQWERLPVEQVRSFCIDASDKIFVVTNDALYSSTDDGSTFSKVNVSPGFGYDVAKSSSGTLLLATQLGLYRSVDDGLTVDNVLGGQHQKIAISNDGTMLAFHGSGSVMRSVDDGLLWNDSDAGIALEFGHPVLSMTALSGEKFAAVVPTGVYLSTDNGVNWTSIAGNLDLSKEMHFMAVVSETPANELLFSGAGGLYRSADLGVSWTKISDEKSLGNVSWVGSEEYASSSDGVRHSSDNGITFTDFSTGITELAASNVTIVDNNLLAVSSLGKVLRSADGGSSWVRVNLTDGPIFGLIRNAAGDLIAYGYGVYKSADAGATWTTLTADGEFRMLSTADGTSFYSYDFVEHEIIFSGDLITWTPVPATGAPFPDPHSMANDDNGIVYLVNINENSVHQVAFGVSKKLDFLETPTNATWAVGKLYIYDSNKGIYETTDGATWVKKTAPRGHKLIIAALNYFFIPPSNMEGAVQVGGDGGAGSTQTGPLWLSRDQGVSWQNVGDAAFGPGAIDVAVNEVTGLAYASIYTSPMHRSNAIVFPDDGAKPVHTPLLPADDATGVPLNTSLSFSFDEGVTLVAGKKVRLFIKGSPTIIEEFDVTEGDQFEKAFTFTLDNPLSYSTEYYVSIESGAYSDLFGNPFDGITTTTAWTFTTKASPLVNTTSPAHNANALALNTALQITFSEPMTGAAGKNIGVYKASSPASPVFTIPASDGVAAGNILNYTLPELLEFETQYLIKCDNNAFVSNDGGFLSVFTTNTNWLFTTRNEPDVISTSPTNNANNVALTTNSFQITFNEPLTGISGKNISLYKVSDPGTAVSTSSVDAGVPSGNTLTFTLPGLLEFETQYFVKCDGDAFLSSDGGTVSAVNINTNWLFTTRDQPVVNSTSPLHDAADVPVTTTSFQITFSETLTGADGKNIALYEVSNPGTPVSTSAADAGVPSGNTLTYTLAVPLQHETQYFIMADEDAFRSAELAAVSLLTASTSWRFTTVEAPDNTPPGIAAFTPVDKAAGIPLTISINATDDKGLAVDKAKFFYRALNSTATHTELPMTNVGTGTAVKFDREISDAFYGDAGGIEFYFQVEDLAGFTKRSPADDTYYYSYLTSLSGASAPLLSGLPGGGSVNGYRIISIPYDLEDNKVATIFNELGTQDVNNWRLLTYGGGGPATWLEFPNGFTTVERGKGYWINVKNPVQLSLEGASSPKNNQSSFFTMQLKSGWNQIGNPYPTPISWEETRLQNENIGKLKIYKGGAAYENGDELKKFEGGFVYLNGPDLAVKVRFKGITSGGREKDLEPNADISGDNWFVPIGLNQGEFTNTLSGIGMHPDAREAYDRFDDFNAPSVFGTFELSFKGVGGEFAVDFTPLADAHAWEFKVKTNLGGHATLQWNNTVFGDNDKELFLFDVGQQRALNMREHGSYTFDPRTSSGFRIYFGRDVMEKIKPDFVMLGDAYPNPSAGTATIPFQLPEKRTAYHVTVEIFDMIGNKVSTVKEGTFAPGFHEATWEAREEQVTDGIYLYRLVVKGDGGHQIQYKKIVLTR